MSFKTQLNTCNSLGDLATLIPSDDTVRCKIGFFGGRYFQHKDNAAGGVVSLNDIVRKLHSLYNNQRKHNMNSVTYAEQLLDKIDFLNQQGKEALAKKSCFTKLFTSWKQRLGNRNYSRDTILGEVRAAVLTLRETPDALNQGDSKHRGAANGWPAPTPAPAPVPPPKSGKDQRSTAKDEANGKQAEYDRRALEDKRAAGKAKGVDALAGKLAAEKDRAEKERAAKKLAAAEELKRRRAEAESKTAGGGVSAPISEALQQKVLAIKHLANLSFADLLKELPKHDGVLSDDCKAFGSTKEKERVVKAILKLKIKKLICRSEDDLKMVRAATQGVSAKTVQMIAEMVIEHSELPVLNICQVLSVFSDADPSKHILDALANRIKTQSCQRADQIEEVQRYRFQVSMIRINHDALFPTYSTNEPSAICIKLFAQAFGQACKELGEETIELMQKQILAKDNANRLYGMGISMPVTQNHFGFSESLVELLHQLKTVPALVSLNLGKNEPNETYSAGNVNEVADAYAVVLHLQPGIVVHNNRFRHVTSPIYGLASMAHSVRVINSFAQQLLHWRTHAIAYLTPDKMARLRPKS